MIVADANIIAYLLLPTSYTESVDTLYQLDSHWMAPVLWKSEFRNILALYLRKKSSLLKKHCTFKRKLSQS